MNKQDVLKQARSELELALLAAQAKFEQAVRQVCGYRISGSFSRRDQMRIMNLLVWSERYCIPLPQLLEFLVSKWAGRFASKKSGKRLGVRPATLAGEKSKQYLLEMLQRKYPEGEQVISYKAQQRLRAALMNESEEPVSDDPRRFVSDYQAQLKQIRENATAASKRFSRRRYRGNPYA